ncbi:hypothetical protein DSO57_1001799 [Entomophthora muscae]|uniref:Uncharacterized protein n=1 Tax=Entomophthora muscae TaxID=34485 RepID=A0ACC2U795_9FUNG|nr:hypothetical protein DSO57_1001799 [Entomophthora muscae]
MLCVELEAIHQEHRQLLDALETLYRDLPECDDEDVQFTVPALIDRVYNLVGENHDLIDRAITLQKLHQDTEADRLEIAHLKSQLEELRLVSRSLPNPKLHLTKGSTLQAELADILDGLRLTSLRPDFLTGASIPPIDSSPFVN